MIPNPWLPFRKCTGVARIRLFCLPHAGGSAAGYLPWARALPGHVEVCPVQLPGRGTRQGDPCRRRLIPLAAEIADAIASATDLPYAIFGHSMGGMLAFETARALLERNAAPPLGLFISSTPSPERLRAGSRHLADDDDLLQSMLGQDGTPEELFAHQDVLALALPRLRIDLEVCETYRFVAATPLTIPITVFGGREDPDVSPVDLRAWTAHTSGAFRVRIFGGGHFYQNQILPDLLSEITADLDAWHGNEALAPIPIPSEETSGNPVRTFRQNRRKVSEPSRNR